MKQKSNKKIINNRKKYINLKINKIYKKNKNNF